MKKSGNQTNIEVENFEELMGVKFTETLLEELGEPEEEIIYEWDGGEYHAKDE